MQATVYTFLSFKKSQLSIVKAFIGNDSNKEDQTGLVQKCFLQEKNPATGQTERLISVWNAFLKNNEPNSSDCFHCFRWNDIERYLSSKQICCRQHN